MLHLLEGSLSIHYLGFFCERNPALLSHLFIIIPSLIYISMCSWGVFYTSDYNPNTILCFVAQIVPVMALGSFFSLAPVFLWDAPFYFLSSSLLSGTTRCFRLILCFLPPRMIPGWSSRLFRKTELGNTRTYIHVYNGFCIYLSVSISNQTRIPTNVSHCDLLHMDHSSLPPLLCNLPHHTPWIVRNLAPTIHLPICTLPVYNTAISKLLTYIPVRNSNLAKAWYLHTIYFNISLTISQQNPIFQSS